MFEQLVRPFQSRQVSTTRRIVPAQRKPDETPEEARIIWGSAGQLPQSVVQPKATNLENIEAVGFNVKGSIDNFHQSSRESEQVDVPIRDNGGNQIGTTTIDRATSVTYTANIEDPRVFYLPNFYGTGTWYDAPGATTPKQSVTPKSPATPPAGMRANVPSSNIRQRTDTYTYPAI